MGDITIENNIQESASRFRFYYTGTNVKDLSSAVYSFFQERGYNLETGTHNNGVYGKGSQVLQILFGCFVNRFKIGVIILEDGDKVVLILTKAMIGFFGGLIGIIKTNNEFKRIADALSTGSLSKSDGSNVSITDNVENVPEQNDDKNMKIMMIIGAVLVGISMIAPLLGLVRGIRYRMMMFSVIQNTVVIIGSVLGLIGYIMKKKWGVIIYTIICALSFAASLIFILIFKFNALISIINIFSIGAIVLGFVNIKKLD